MQQKKEQTTFISFVIYTLSGRTERWPMRIFYGILDQAIVNARILLTFKYSNDNVDKKITAIDCLETLHLYLVKPHLERSSYVAQRCEDRHRWDLEKRHFN